jgi:hypothetical protein
MASGAVAKPQIIGRPMFCFSFKCHGSDATTGH